MLKKLFLLSLLLIVCFLISSPAALAGARLVVVDPGHGGWDAGAIGPTKYLEKTANLDIGLRLKQLLLNGGYQVVMTREGDISLDLEARVRIANQAKANIFISVHNNSDKSTAAQGTETYYWAYNGSGYNPESKRLATLIQKEVVKQTGLYDRGVKYARLYVISPNRIKMPGALVEGAFISNPTEEALLKTASFRQKIAQGIYNGIRLFQPPDNVDSFSLTVPAKTRRSVYINDYLTNVAYGVDITANAGFVAERAMYYNLGGLSDVSNSLALPSPKNVWFFAEGFTASGFDTYFTLVNPTPYTANVQLTYFLDNGQIKSQGVSVKPGGRQTVLVDQLLPSASFGTRIVSNYPIAAERAMYFSTGWTKGVSTAMGSPYPRYQWFFAQGKAATGFDSWLLLLNPNSTAVTATITFYPENSRPFTTSLTLPPARRSSILLDNYISGSFGFKVSSSLPVVAERSMYFNENNISGGHTVQGRPKPSQVWHFTEGFTGGQFATNYNLLNPNAVPASVSVTYYTPSGEATTTRQVLPPETPLTVAARDLSQIGPDKEFAVTIRSDQPILAERSVYYTLGGLNGGAAEFGAYGLTKRRLLAEGFTGSGFDNWLLLFNPNDTDIKVNVRFLK